jgi:hypothetical protein
MEFCTNRAGDAVDRPFSKTAMVWRVPIFAGNNIPKSRNDFVDYRDRIACVLRRQCTTFCKIVLRFHNDKSRIIAYSSMHIID